MMQQYSRRDFLRQLGLAGVTLAALWQLPKAQAQPARPLPPADQLPPLWQYGRSLGNGVAVRAAPDHTAQRLAFLAEDDVVPLYGQVEGTGSPNNTWYQLANGFVYATWLQLVEWQYQTNPRRLSQQPFLVDVSIPFVDARVEPDFDAPTAYRLYYGSTFWVKDAVVGAGSTWYKLWDERLTRVYYAPATALRRFNARDFLPISPAVPADAKRIVVDTNAQQMTAYEYDSPVMTAQIATGAWYKEKGKWEDYTTTPGRYRILWKMPSRHMAGGDLAAGAGFDLPGVPWCSYFSDTGMAFHGTYWHNEYGLRRSHGCVNLPSHLARWVYRWTSPHLGDTEMFRTAAYREGTQIDVV